MISMRIVILIATVAVNGRGAKDVSGQQVELFEGAPELSSVPPERSKRAANSSTNNETARNKRQIPCCYGNPYPIITECSSVPLERSERVADSSTNNEAATNKRRINCCYNNPYPIITLPSCSIPYTIINGTCYLATCPKLCNNSLLRHTTCFKGINPCVSKFYHSRSCHPICQAIPQELWIENPQVDFNENSTLDSGNNSTKIGATAGSTESRTRNDSTGVSNITHSKIPDPPKEISIVNETPTTMHDKAYNNITTLQPINDKSMGNNNKTPTTANELSNNNSTSTSNEASSTTPSSPINFSTTGTIPWGKHDKNCSYIPYFCFGNNSTAPSMSDSHKSECEVCECFCNPVAPEQQFDGPELQFGERVPEQFRANSVLDKGYSCCNDDWPVYSSSCSCCDNILGRPMKETAGLMRGSGNGEGGNMIISNMNILAGPSCVDPCGNQNACMLSNSGNGQGGNKIISNGNYVNGGNLLCCSGNGKGGNCIRTMVNIVGGNSAKVLSSCDGKLLKQLCDFFTIDECSKSKSANVTEPVTEPPNSGGNLAPDSITITNSEMLENAIVEDPLNATTVTPKVSPTPKPGVDE